MNTIDTIHQQLGKLPQVLHSEVLDFIEYLLVKAERKSARRENSSWSSFSLERAMRDMEDDGSPVYRVGQGGKLFHYFKFRSMVPGTDSLRYDELAEKNLRNDGPMVKIKDDPRVTRVGNFIRRWSVDELAELFLVLKGEMSLVGPRPHLPEEVAKYERHHKKVLTVKPGITGLAQISGRSDLTFEEEVKLDTYYVENWSVLLDLAILMRTPWAVVRGRKAE